VTSTLVILAVLAAVAFLVGRFGTDSRPTDPSDYDARWPFHRHEG
jgi:hypothetical protein